MKRSETVKNTAPATSQSTISGTSVSPMRTLKKMTSEMTFATGAK